MKANLTPTANSCICIDLHTQEVASSGVTGPSRLQIASGLRYNEFTKMTAMDNRKIITVVNRKCVFLPSGRWERCKTVIEVVG